MATLTIRDLPDEVRDKLRVRAAQNRRSMEAEVRSVLSGSVGLQGNVERQNNWDAAVREAQEAFTPYRNPVVSVVDELIADRRLEAWRETVRGYVSLNRNAPSEPLQLRNPRS